MKPVDLLVVDDDVFLLEVLKDVFTDAGFNVHTAIDGQEAKKLLATERVDAVLTDGQYPDGGALGLLKYMKGDDRLSMLPVVVLTGGTDTRDPVFTGIPVLSKPAPLDKLIYVMKEAGTKRSTPTPFAGLLALTM